MVLKIRLNRRAEETVEQAFDGVEGFQKYMNEHPSWMFQQQERKYVAGKWVTYRPSTVMLCERIKLVLSPPVIVSNGKDTYFYNRIITVLQPNRNDRADALGGKEVTEPIEIEPDIPDRLPRPPTPTTTATVTKTEEQAQGTVVTGKEEAGADVKPAKPSPVQEGDRQRFIVTPLCPKCGGKLVPLRGLYCQGCGVKLPDKLAVHREVVVAIQPGSYKALATYLKQELNVAWSQLTRGRKVEKVSAMGQNVFLISVEDEMRTSTRAQESRLDDLLIQTGIGRLTTDPYEIKETHAMLAGRQQNPAH